MATIEYRKNEGGCGHSEKRDVTEAMATELVTKGLCRRCWQESWADKQKFGKVKGVDDDNKAIRDPGHNQVAYARDVQHRALSLTYTPTNDVRARKQLRELTQKISDAEWWIVHDKLPLPELFEAGSRWPLAEKLHGRWPTREIEKDGVMLDEPLSRTSAARRPA